jgi:hypothetical protein
VTRHFVKLQERQRANLLRIATHQHYIVTEWPDGTLIWEPAEVGTVSERKLLENTALRASVAADLEDPTRLAVRERRRDPNRRRRAQLRFGREANGLLTQLETDTTLNSELLGKVHMALDQLEAHPEHPWCRHQHFQHLGLWAVSFVHDGRQWLILWSSLDAADVVVHAVVPAP